MRVFSNLEHTFYMISSEHMFRSWYIVQEDDYGYHIQLRNFHKTGYSLHHFHLDYGTDKEISVFLLLSSSHE